MNKVGLKITIVLLALLCSPALALDWQGYGNMSSSNLTSIWAYVDSHANVAVSQYDASTTHQSMDQFATNFSTYLNELWNPAWNVIICYQTPYDTIVYGYAFRDHWMWYNNYQVSGKRLNLVIWKDYNCYKWQKLSTVSSGFDSTERAAIAYGFTKVTSSHINDIWGGAKVFMNNFMSKLGQSGNIDKAYTVVMTQVANEGSIHGSVCSFEDKISKNVFSFNGGTLTGFFTLFRTR